MSTFQIKVCGITRAQDASLAASLGADMIGMIFYPKSPRCITKAQARAIGAALPSTIDRVAVFVNERIDRVLRTCAQLDCQYAQLHGSEAAADILTLQQHGIRVIKAFGPSNRADWECVRTCNAELVLVDSMSPSLPGGNGKPFDWNCRPVSRIRNLVLAGGISVANLEDGVRMFHPLVIDVNSSVETSPGIKSGRKLKQFFKRCNELRNGN